MKFWFLNIQSQAANCELPKKRYMARFNNCNFNKTNKVSIIIIIITISIKLRGSTIPWTVEIQVSSIYDFYEKKRDFLVDGGQKLVARGHQALPQHSLDIHIPDFKVVQPALRHIFCVIVCFWFTGKWMIQDMILHFWEGPNHGIRLLQQMEVWKKITRVQGKFEQDSMQRK